MSTKDDVRVNDRITSREIRVIDHHGDNLGVITTKEALRIAEQAGLDLVEISPTANPPVCKVMDYGKYKYEAQKKAREAHKKQKIIEIKEVKMRPVIDKHDFAIKMNNALRFLGEGDKVKFFITFKGREMDHMEIGHELMQRIKETLADKAKIEQDSRQEGRSLTLLAGPVPHQPHKH